MQPAKITRKMWFATLKFLFRWEKSIYKTLWLHTFIYTVMYYIVGLIYKFLLDDDEQKTFEAISLAFSKLPDTVTLVLILGFIATQIMARWWSLYSTIPGTGKIITVVQFYAKRNAPNKEAWLRTLTRYILLSWLLFMRTMCYPIWKKYPTLESIERVGLILSHEIDVLKAMAKFEDESKYSLYVINWAVALVREAKDEAYFENVNDASRVLDPILAFKKSCSTVLKFKVTQIPPKFIQLVTIVVFSFGAVLLMGRQFVEPTAPVKVLFIESMYYLPVLPTMQYLVFLAWFRLAMEANDALGDDDTDFQMFEVFCNHVEAADNLLRLFELDQFNPIKESMAKVQSTLFRLDPSEKTRPLKLGLQNNPSEETENEFL